MVCLAQWTVSPHMRAPRQLVLTKTPQFSALALRMRCDGACRAVLKQSGLEAAALEQNVQCLI